MHARSYATQTPAALQARLSLTANDFQRSSSLLIGVALFRRSPKLQLLVLRRAANEDLFPNCWAVPGGHIDAGESVGEGLRREMQEETGLVISKVLAEFNGMVWFDEEGRRAFQLNFIVDVERSKEVVLRKEEHATWMWVDEEQAKTLHCSENMAAMLQDAFRAAKATLG